MQTHVRPTQIALPAKSQQVAVAPEASAALQAERRFSSAGSPGTSSGSSASDQSRFGADEASEGERGWSGLRETRWPWPKKLSALLSACSGNLGALSGKARCSLGLLHLGSLASYLGDLGLPLQPSMKSSQQGPAWLGKPMWTTQRH